MSYSGNHNVDDIGDLIWNIYVNFRLELSKYGWSAAQSIAIWIFIYYLACLVLYALLDRCNSWSATKLKKTRRSLFIIAHPDDECMFFGPSILHFMKQNVEVHLLCLSKGNLDGQGMVRCQELYNACKVLGIRECHVTIFNDTCLPDDSQTWWAPERVAEIIQHHVEANDVDTIVTFDKDGVSFHSNHRAIFYAIACLTLERKISPDCRIFTLDSVNLLRKYWGYLDLPLSFLLSSYRFVLSIQDRKLLIEAMKQHQSQMLWFRRLYLIFSRFILINTLKEVSVSDVELEMEIDDQPIPFLD